MKIYLEVDVEPHVEGINGPWIAGFVEQVIESDSESRDYEEQHGVLDKADRAFTIKGVSALTHAYVLEWADGINRFSELFTTYADADKTGENLTDHFGTDVVVADPVHIDLTRKIQTYPLSLDANGFFVDEPNLKTFTLTVTVELPGDAVEALEDGGVTQNWISEHQVVVQRQATHVDEVLAMVERALAGVSEFTVDDYGEVQNEA